MTDSSDRTELNEDMDPRFENLAGYVLGALDGDDERASVERLIERDSEVQAEFEDLSDAVEHLAFGVPAVEPPSHLKLRIMNLVAAESGQASAGSSAATPNTVPVLPWWSRMIRSGMATSAAAAIFVVIVAGVLGFQNYQLNGEVESLRADLATETELVASIQTEFTSTMSASETKVASMKSEMESMESEVHATTNMLVHQESMVSELTTANTALRQALRDQSWMTYVSARDDYQVASWLANNQQSAVQPEVDASGIIVVKIVGNEAVFQVHGLDKTLPGFAYTLWLLGNGSPQPVAEFEVSEIGSATVPFLLPAPLQFYSSIVVTQERSNGMGTDPTGVMVLSAETN